MKEQWLELKDEDSKKKFVQDRVEQVKQIREVSSAPRCCSRVLMLSRKHVEELNVWQEELKQNKGHANDALKKKRIEMYVTLACDVNAPAQVLMWITGLKSDCERKAGEKSSRGCHTRHGQNF